ncbi:MAG TPA: hypothetical protein VFJ90_04215 [Candidatus Didemnitutus sp.]|nr:hypothetical protein [Candidatus Didemnitutus sp.]
MPGYILHQGATVLCMHGGSAQATVPNPRVKVASQVSVQQPNPWTIAGCPFMTGSNPMPCVTAQWTVAATRVKSGGLPLLLQDSVAVCAPNGTGVNIVVTQVRVKAQ